MLFVLLTSGAFSWKREKCLFFQFEGLMRSRDARPAGAARKTVFPANSDFPSSDGTLMAGVPLVILHSPHMPGFYRSQQRSDSVIKKKRDKAAKFTRHFITSKFNVKLYVPTCRNSSITRKIYQIYIDFSIEK